MATALVSLLTDTPVRPNVAMTGEITLRGRVLPVGGIKQKVLAAARVGLDTVIVPKRNEPDLDDVPEEIRKQLTFVFAEEVDDVLEAALSRGLVHAKSMEEDGAALEPVSEDGPEGDETVLAHD